MKIFIWLAFIRFSSPLQLTRHSNWANWMNNSNPYTQNALNTPRENASTSLGPNVTFGT